MSHPIVQVKREQGLLLQHSKETPELLVFTKADFHKTLQSLNWPSEYREMSSTKEKWAGQRDLTRNPQDYRATVFLFVRSCVFSPFAGLFFSKRRNTKGFLIDLCLTSRPRREMAKLGLAAFGRTFVWEGHLMIREGLWPTKQTPWCQGGKQTKSGLNSQGKDLLSREIH